MFQRLPPVGNARAHAVQSGTSIPRRLRRVNDFEGSSQVYVDVTEVDGYTSGEVFMIGFNTAVHCTGSAG